MMNWKVRAPIAVVAMAVLLEGVALLLRAKMFLGAFLLIIVCALVICVECAPMLAQYAAASFIDFIYSTNGTSAQTDGNDPAIYEQSQKVFWLLRACGCLALAGGLYGICWATPILLRWPPMLDLEKIPHNLVTASLVGALSALEWIFYIAFYFMPKVWNGLGNCLMNWRVRREQAQ